MLELVEPLMKLKELDGPTYWNCKPATAGGVGVACGWPSLNLSESVAFSPSVNVSRSSAAVNDAASAAPGSSAVANSLNQIFSVNRMIFSVSILTETSGKCSQNFLRLKVKNHRQRGSFYGPVICFCMAARASRKSAAVA